MYPRTHNEAKNWSSVTTRHNKAKIYGGRWSFGYERQHCKKTDKLGMRTECVHTQWSFPWTNPLHPQCWTFVCERLPSIDPVVPQIKHRSKTFWQNLRRKMSFCKYNNTAKNWSSLYDNTAKKQTSSACGQIVHTLCSFPERAPPSPLLIVFIISERTPHIDPSSGSPITTGMKQWQNLRRKTLHKTQTSSACGQIVHSPCSSPHPLRWSLIINERLPSIHPVVFPNKKRNNN